MNLIEYDSKGSEHQAHKLRKKLPLSPHPTRVKATGQLNRKATEASHYEFGFLVAPQAAPFYIKMASARVLEIHTPNCSVQQIGKRVQGKFPEGSGDPRLVMSFGESTSNIDIENGNGVHLINSAGVIEFDVCTSRLRRSLPAHINCSDAFIFLMLDDHLVSGCECTLPSMQQTISSVELLEKADGNDVILAAAEYELRRNRNCASLNLLERVTEPDPLQELVAAKIRMRALLNQRRFAEAIALYEAQPRMENDFKSRTRYIEACASTHQYEKTKAEMEKVVTDVGSSEPGIFAKLYRYAHIIEERYRSLFAERLLDSVGELGADRKVLVHLGHDFTEREDWPGLFQVVAALERYELNDTERARVALLMAQVAHRLGDVGQFLARLNEALRSLKVQPISLIDARRGLRLDNFKAEFPLESSGGPLVSVLMTSFNSESTINYAMNSVLAQSYRNIELLVVDDCSEDRSRDIISDVAKRDLRVVPIFRPFNSGTYACKNVALTRASGEYITCQDSDDWAHPQKIDTCVRRLNKDRSLIATGVQQVRLSAEDGIQMKKSDYIQPEAPSLMYRAEPVRRSLGFYDSVRVGADTEFERRMKATFGPEAVRYGQELLSLALWSSSSLTGGGAFAIDHVSGVMAPSRNRYRREYLRWHEKADRLYIHFPMGRRPFPAPEEML